MKKLLFTASITVIACVLLVSFKNNKAKFVPAPVTATLNGIDSVIAKQMIDSFGKHYTQDIGPKSVSAWYSIDQIKEIAKILEAEHTDPNIQADGIRLYFGCDGPAKNTTKLKVKILLVSTKPIKKAVAGYSKHVDYYTHNSSILGVETGIAVNDGCLQVIKDGGGLYDTTAPADVDCLKPSNHFLGKGVAYEWVRARCETNTGSNRNDGGYNTKSEWFSYCFLSELFKAVVNTNNKLSGIRIYLGNGLVDSTLATKRDVFILVPTELSGQKHIDHYKCLEDLPGVAICDDIIPMYKHTLIKSGFFKPNQIKSFEIESFTNHFDKANVDKTESKAQQRKKLAFAAALHKMGDAYDEGELCPLNCQVDSL